METWIIYVIAPIAIALVSWILGKNGRRIDETSKLVALLQEEITRLTAKVEKLEAKVEIKEHESERKSGIIQEAFRCKTPSHKCPVLIKLFEFNDQKEDEQRTKKLQPGEYPPECDQIQRERRGVLDPAFKAFGVDAVGATGRCSCSTYPPVRYGCRTLREMILRYAPPVENHTENYIRAVARAQVSPDEPLDTKSGERMIPVVAAMSPRGERNARTHGRGSGGLGSVHSTLYDTAANPPPASWQHCSAPAPSRRTAAVTAERKTTFGCRCSARNSRRATACFFPGLVRELIRNLDGERHLHRVVGEGSRPSHEYDTSRPVDTLTGTLPPAAGDHPTAAPYGFHSRGGPCTTDRTPNPGRHDPRRRSCQAAASDGRKYLPAGPPKQFTDLRPSASRPHLVAACPVHCRTAGRGLWHPQIIQHR